MRKKAIVSANKNGFFWFSLTTVTVVVLAGDVEHDWQPTHSLVVISTLKPSFHRDAHFLAIWKIAEVYKKRSTIAVFLQFLIAILSIPLCLFQICKFAKIMAENIRRALQDIDLGANDDPIPLPIDVVNQAAAENRFIIMGRPVMPRRQNLRSIVSAMPRLWGQAGLVHGRIVEGRRFQFVFPSEESMETVLRRGPWAFADRMIVLQRWTPLMNVQMLNFIPFWIQVRGIPLQYMNQEVVAHIGRALGMLMDIDYDQAAAQQVEYVRVRLNWQIDQPLRFQRNFQFTPGVNTLLRFRYKRLRGFCEVCGMLTHDSGACLIHNGGGDPHSDDEDSDDGNQPPGFQPNNNVHIQEINEAEQNEEDMAEDNVIMPNGVAEQEEDTDADTMLDLYKAYQEPEEDIKVCQKKRKLDAGPDDTRNKITVREKGEGSGTSQATDHVGGAVGPNPPEAP